MDSSKVHPNLPYVRNETGVGNRIGTHLAKVNKQFLKEEKSIHFLHFALGIEVKAVSEGSGDRKGEREEIIKKKKKEESDDI